jgi:ABC-type uncharacterized transport system ATPase subunit
MIEVRGLTKRYGETTAVSGLSFNVMPGKVTGFLGPNGAGKPVAELRHSLLARQADCRSPGQRPSSRTRPPPARDTASARGPRRAADSVIG